MHTLLRILKEPGSIRILAGGCTVLLLLVLATFGEVFVQHKPSEMDSENMMSPPTNAFFRSFLITEKGLQNLGLKPVSLPNPNNENQPQEPSSQAEGNLENSSRVNIQGETLQESSTDNQEEGGDTSEYNDEDEEEFAYLEEDKPAPQKPSANTEAPEPSGYTADEDEALDYLTDDVNDPTEPQDEQSVASSNHPLGTDKDGRDILSLIIAGAKTCILPGLLACLVALGLGIPMGILGGYYGGKIAGTVQMFNGIVLSFPRFVLILVVICALEPNVYYTMIVLGLTIVPRISELMRSRVGSLSKLGFILAAKESGLSDFKIMTRHLFWYSNRTVFFIQSSLVMAESILVETTLSYLQFGTKAPEVSWGNIIEGSRMSFFSEYYWITFFPALAIVVSILGFYYLGDGLNARMEYDERQ